jgi:hypothetical protein
MTAAEDDAIRARLASMTVEELRRAVTTERDDYVPRALALTEEELARRASADPDRGDSHSPSPTGRATARTRWWHVWLSVVAAASVLNVVVYVAFRGFSADVVPRAFWALIVVPIALHFRRKERGDGDEEREPEGDSSGPPGSA